MNRTLTLTPEQQQFLKGLVILNLPDGHYQLVIDSPQWQQLEKYGYLHGHYIPIYPGMRGYGLTPKGKQAAEDMSC